MALQKFNIQSNLQLQAFLFDFLGLIATKTNELTGNRSVDEETITLLAEKEDILFCTLLRDYRKLEKAIGTYLSGIERNITMDMLLHPDFWLNTVETFRSSSSNPNFQNIPKHGDLIAGIPWVRIRKIFAEPRTGWMLFEVDYEGAEVKIAAKLGNDPVMINDLNTGLDQHSYWANVLFGLGIDDLGFIKKNHKEERFLAKNNFTFANIYGAANTSIAAEMRKSEFYKKYVWTFFQKTGRKTAEWDQFFIDWSEKHIAECQAYFFERYHVFKTWQDGYVNSYYERGYCDTPLGFRRWHPLKRNEIINTPIQATSFHLLLHSIIRIEKALEEGNFLSRLIGQIHDSAMFRMKNEEAPEVMEIVDDIMTHPEFEFWNKEPIVNLGTEWEAGHNWLEMSTVSEYKKAA